MMEPTEEPTARGAEPTTQAAIDAPQAQTVAERHSSGGRGMRHYLAKHREVIKDYTQVFALLLAAGWAVYVFIYENVYKPATETPNVVLSTSLEKGGTKGNLTAVKAKAVARSVGKTDAKILGAWLNVQGFKVNARGEQECAKDDAAYQNNIETQLKRKREGTNLDIDMHASRCSDYNEDNKGTYIFSSNFLINHSSLRPGEEDSKAITFFVNERDYDLVRMVLHILVTEDDRFIRAEWRVHPGGELELVRYIRACSTCGEEKFDATNRNQRELARKYGMFHNQSVVDLPLWGEVTGQNEQTSVASPLVPETEPAPLP